MKSNVNQYYQIWSFKMYYTFLCIFFFFTVKTKKKSLLKNYTAFFCTEAKIRLVLIKNLQSLHCLTSGMKWQHLVNTTKACIHNNNMSYVRVVQIRTTYI